MGLIFDPGGHQGLLEGARTLKKRVSEWVPQKSMENESWARAQFSGFPEDLSGDEGVGHFGLVLETQIDKKRFGGSREALEGAPEEFQIFGSAFE